MRKWVLNVVGVNTKKHEIGDDQLGDVHIHRDADRPAELTPVEHTQGDEKL